jgi:hypothetical protein
MAMARDTYWAADTDVEKVVAALDERVDDFYRYVQNGSKGSFLNLWSASNRACFSGFYTGGEIGKAGKQGEIRTVEVNEYGNLHQHLVTMITGQRPAFEARTDTVDSRAQQQAPVGLAVVESALREKGLEDVSLSVADTMIRAGEGWGYKRWDPQAGPDYTTEPETNEDGTPKVDEVGQPILRSVPAGDVSYQAFHPLDIARDPTRPATDKAWRVVRRRANKWDLAAQFGKIPAGEDRGTLGDRILGAPTIIEAELKRPLLVPSTEWSTNRSLCDDVWIYEAILDRSPALPDGRLVIYTTPDCVLFDGPLPYRTNPLFRSAAKDLEGTAFGYSLLWDVLAPQLALNNILSHITTLAADLGAVVWEPEGMGQSPTRWKGVLTILKGGSVAPQVLDLLKIPAELFKLVEFYIGSMERLSGINATFRGQAGEGQKNLSGAAYALFLENIATATIQDYQDMGSGRYLLNLAGEGNAYRVQEFMAGRTPKGGDAPGTPPRIDKVTNITVRLTNPLQSTTAGRMQMFDSLKTIDGAITSPESALQVLNTGKLEPATQSAQREVENITKENEKLGKGEPVSALVTDRHWLHIPEHSAVGASPEARENPATIKALGIHLNEHGALLRSMDPVVAMAMGCPPEILQMLAMSMAPPPMPGDPSASPPGAPGASSASGDIAPPSIDPAGGTQMPKMPKNPMTGERAPSPRPPNAA